jgi:hypothetical protein
MADSSKLGTDLAGFEVDTLVQAVEDLTNNAKAKIDDIKERGDSISIADMFDMQMQMNHLSQMSEATTAVVNACNTAIMSMARNVKG